MVLIDAGPIAGAHAVAAWRLTITPYLAALAEGTRAIILVCVVSRVFGAGGYWWGSYTVGRLRRRSGSAIASDICASHLGGLKLWVVIRRTEAHIISDGLGSHKAGGTEGRLGWGEVVYFKVGFSIAESDCRVRSRVRLTPPYIISEDSHIRQWQRNWG